MDVPQGRDGQDSRLIGLLEPPPHVDDGAATRHRRLDILSQLRERGELVGRERSEGADAKGEKAVAGVGELAYMADDRGEGDVLGLVGVDAVEHHGWGGEVAGDVEEEAILGLVCV
jgi:hypothetical protein